MVEVTGVDEGRKMKLQEHLRALAESAKTIHKCNKALTAALTDHVQRLSALANAGRDVWELGGWTVDAEGKPVNGPDKVAKAFFSDFYGHAETLAPPKSYRD